MISVAGILRKSPTNKNVKENIEDYKKRVEGYVSRRWGDDVNLKFFVDENVSGDADLDERVELAKFFKYIDTFDFAVCTDVTRFSRSWLGIKWYFEYFCTDNGRKPHDGCKLIFLEGVPSLYEKDNTANIDAVNMFSILCMFAQIDLMRIRINPERGRARLRGTPEWKKKFRGRPR